MDDKTLPPNRFNLLNMLFFLSRFSWVAVVLIPVLMALHTTHALVERALGQVDVVTSIEGVYDSNIFSSPSEEGDFLVRFSPVVNYKKRLGPLVLGANLGGNFGRYFEHSDEDYSNPITNFNFRMAEDFGLFSVDKRTTGKIQFGFDTDISQRTETNEQLQDLINYTLYSVSSNVRYNHSPKFGVGSDITYELRNYQKLSSQGLPYHDMQSLRLGSSAYYIYSPKLDFFLNYQYVINESPNSDSDFINNNVQNYSFGMEGQITPKLSGNLSFGFGVRDYEVASVQSEDTLLFNAGLVWSWREKTKMSVNLNRGFAPSPQDQGMLTTDFAFQLNQRFNRRVAGTLGVSYGIVDFTSNQNFGPFSQRNDRTDDRWGVNLGILSNFTSYLDGRFGYSFVKTSSGLGDEFSNNRHLATITFIVQY